MDTKEKLGFKERQNPLTLMPLKWDIFNRLIMEALVELMRFRRGYKEINLIVSSVFRVGFKGIVNTAKNVIEI